MKLLDNKVRKLIVCSLLIVSCADIALPAMADYMTSGQVLNKVPDAKGNYVGGAYLNNVTGATVLADKDNNAATITNTRNISTLNWDSLNTAHGQSLNYVFNAENGSGQISLNNVTGTGLSTFAGSLTSGGTGSGRIIISNPNGILFENGSFTDVNALTLTTKNVTIGKDSSINIGYDNKNKLINSNKDANSYIGIKSQSFHVANDLNIVAPEINISNANITAGNMRLYTADGVTFYQDPSNAERDLEKENSLDFSKNSDASGKITIIDSGLSIKDKSTGKIYILAKGDVDINLGSSKDKNNVINGDLVAKSVYRNVSSNTQTESEPINSTTFSTSLLQYLWGDGKLSLDEIISRVSTAFKGKNVYDIIGMLLNLRSTYQSTTTATKKVTYKITSTTGCGNVNIQDSNILGNASLDGKTVNVTNSGAYNLDITSHNAQNGTATRVDTETTTTQNSYDWVTTYFDPLHLFPSGGYFNKSTPKPVGNTTVKGATIADAGSTIDYGDVTLTNVKVGNFDPKADSTNTGKLSVNSDNAITANGITTLGNTNLTADSSIDVAKSISSNNSFSGNLTTNSNSYTNIADSTVNGNLNSTSADKINTSNTKVGGAISAQANNAIALDSTTAGADSTINTDSDVNISNGSNFTKGLTVAGAIQKVDSTVTVGSASNVTVDNSSVSDLNATASQKVALVNGSKFGHVRAFAADIDLNTKASAGNAEFTATNNVTLANATTADANISANGNVKITDSTSTGKLTVSNAADINIQNSSASGADLTSNKNITITGNGVDNKMGDVVADAQNAGTITVTGMKAKSLNLTSEKATNLYNFSDDTLNQQNKADQLAGKDTINETGRGTVSVTNTDVEGLMNVLANKITVNGGTAGSLNATAENNRISYGANDLFDSENVGTVSLGTYSVKNQNNDTITRGFHTTSGDMNISGGNVTLDFAQAKNGGSIYINKPSSNAYSLDNFENAVASNPDKSNLLSYLTNSPAKSTVNLKNDVEADKDIVVYGNNITLDNVLANGNISVYNLDNGNNGVNTAAAGTYASYLDTLLNTNQTPKTDLNKLVSHKGDINVASFGDITIGAGTSAQNNINILGNNVTLTGNAKASGGIIAAVNNIENGATTNFTLALAGNKFTNTNSSINNANVYAKEILLDKTTATATTLNADNKFTSQNGTHLNAKSVANATDIDANNTYMNDSTLNASNDLKTSGWSPITNSHLYAKTIEGNNNTQFTGSDLHASDSITLSSLSFNNSKAFANDITLQNGAFVTNNSDLHADNSLNISGYSKIQDSSAYAKNLINDDATPIINSKLTSDGVINFYSTQIQKNGKGSGVGISGGSVITADTINLNNLSFTDNSSLKANTINVNDYSKISSSYVEANKELNIKDGTPVYASEIHAGTLNLSGKAAINGFTEFKDSNVTLALAHPATIQANSIVSDNSIISGETVNAGLFDMHNSSTLTNSNVTTTSGLLSVKDSALKGTNNLASQNGNSIEITGSSIENTIANATGNGAKVTISDTSATGSLNTTADGDVSVTAIKPKSSLTDVTLTSNNGSVTLDANNNTIGGNLYAKAKTDTSISNANAGTNRVIALGNTVSVNNTNADYLISGSNADPKYLDKNVSPGISAADTVTMDQKSKFNFVRVFSNNINVNGSSTISGGRLFAINKLNVNDSTLSNMGFARGNDTILNGATINNSTLIGATSLTLDSGSKVQDSTINAGKANIKIGSSIANTKTTANSLISESGSSITGGSETVAGEFKMDTGSILDNSVVNAGSLSSKISTIRNSSEITVENGADIENSTLTSSNISTNKGLLSIQNSILTGVNKLSSQNNIEIINSSIENTIANAVGKITVSDVTAYDNLSLTADGAVTATNLYVTADGAIPATKNVTLISNNSSVTINGDKNVIGKNLYAKAKTDTSISNTDAGSNSVIALGQNVTVDNLKADYLIAGADVQPQYTSKDSKTGIGVADSVTANNSKFNFVRIRSNSADIKGQSTISGGRISTNKTIDINNSTFANGTLDSGAITIEKNSTLTNSTATTAQGLLSVQDSTLTGRNTLNSQSDITINNSALDKTVLSAKGKITASDVTISDFLNAAADGDVSVTAIKPASTLKATTLTSNNGSVTFDANNNTIAGNLYAKAKTTTSISNVDAGKNRVIALGDTVSVNNTKADYLISGSNAIVDINHYIDKNVDPSLSAAGTVTIDKNSQFNFARVLSNDLNVNGGSTILGGNLLANNDLKINNSLLSNMEISAGGLLSVKDSALKGTNNLASQNGNSIEITGSSIENTVATATGKGAKVTISDTSAAGSLTATADGDVSVTAIKPKSSLTDVTLTSNNASVTLDANNNKIGGNLYAKAKTTTSISNADAGKNRVIVLGNTVSVDNLTADYLIAGSNADPKYLDKNVSPGISEADNVTVNNSVLNFVRVFSNGIGVTGKSTKISGGRLFAINKLNVNDSTLSNMGFARGNITTFDHSSVDNSTVIGATSLKLDNGSYFNNTSISAGAVTANSSIINQSKLVSTGLFDLNNFSSITNSTANAGELKIEGNSMANNVGFTVGGLSNIFNSALIDTTLNSGSIYANGTIFINNTNLTANNGGISLISSKAFDKVVANATGNILIQNTTGSANMTVSGNQISIAKSRFGDTTINSASSVDSSASTFNSLGLNAVGNVSMTDSIVNKDLAVATNGNLTFSGIGIGGDLTVTKANDVIITNSTNKNSENVPSILTLANGAAPISDYNHLKFNDSFFNNLANAYGSRFGTNERISYIGGNTSISNVNSSNIFNTAFVGNLTQSNIATDANLVTSFVGGNYTPDRVTIKGDANVYDSFIKGTFTKNYLDNLNLDDVNKLKYGTEINANFRQQFNPRGFAANDDQIRANKNQTISSIVRNNSNPNSIQFTRGFRAY